MRRSKGSSLSRTSKQPRSHPRRPPILMPTTAPTMTRPRSPMRHPTSWPVTESETNVSSRLLRSPSRLEPNTHQRFFRAQVRMTGRRDAWKEIERIESPANISLCIACVSMQVSCRALLLRKDHFQGQIRVKSVSSFAPDHSSMPWMTAAAPD